MQDVYGQIISEWKNDPKLRAEFSSFVNFAAFRERDIARQTGQSVEDLRKQNANVTAHIAAREAVAPLTAAERASIEASAAKWNADAAIRKEFSSFANFATLSWAEQNGRVKQYGKRT